MEFKGTKGKWTVDSSDHTLVIPDIRYTNEAICRCFSRNYTGNKFEDVANAKLISKAPELLEQLQSLTDMVVRKCSIGNDPALSELFTEVQKSVQLIESATRI
jgi:hypothetical protein